MTGISYSALSNTATKPLKNEYSPLPTGENEETLDLADAEAIDRYDRSVKHFLMGQKKYLIQAYKTYGGSTLHYCLILKKDTTTTRGKFYDFLDNYAKNRAFSQRFPIVFKFIPAEYIEHLLEQAEPIF
jgi:hypothetical protein